MLYAVVCSTAFNNQQSEYLQLEPVLTDVSKTGVVRFPWKLIQPLLRYRMKSVLDEAYGGVKNIPDDDKDLSRQLLERFDTFKEYEIHSKYINFHTCVLFKSF